MSNKCPLDTLTIKHWNVTSWCHCWGSYSRAWEYTLMPKFGWQMNLLGVQARSDISRRTPFKDKLERQLGRRSGTACGCQSCDENSFVVRTYTDGQWKMAWLVSGLEVEKLKTCDKLMWSRCTWMAVWKQTKVSSWYMVTLKSPREALNHQVDAMNILAIFNLSK